MRTLPIGLVDSLGWFTVLATTFISFAFIGIEAIGIEIEDPFGQDPNDLPLEGICIGIETHLLNLYNQNGLFEVIDMKQDKNYLIVKCVRLLILECCYKNFIKNLVKSQFTAQ